MFSQYSWEICLWCMCINFIMNLVIMHEHTHTHTHTHRHHTTSRNQQWQMLSSMQMKQICHKEFPPGKVKSNQHYKRRYLYIITSPSLSVTVCLVGFYVWMSFHLLIFNFLLFSLLICL